MALNKKKYGEPLPNYIPHNGILLVTSIKDVESDLGKCKEVRYVDIEPKITDQNFENKLDSRFSHPNSNFLVKVGEIDILSGGSEKPLRTRSYRVSRKEGTWRERGMFASTKRYRSSEESDNPSRAIITSNTSKTNVFFMEEKLFVFESFIPVKWEKRTYLGLINEIADADEGWKAISTTYFKKHMELYYPEVEI